MFTSKVKVINGLVKMSNNIKSLINKKIEESEQVISADLFNLDEHSCYINLNHNFEKSKKNFQKWNSNYSSLLTQR